jgi:hypothetical protein
MKVSPLLILVVAAFACQTAYTKPKGKGQAPAAPAASADSPSEALAPFINQIDQLLALERVGGPKLQVFYTQVPGRLATLRAQFVSRQNTADEAGKARFGAAVATCDALTAALDERQKVLGDIRTSQTVKGSGKLDQGPRKDDLTQGIQGGDKAKAVGAIVERDREKAANRKAAAQAAKNGNALTAMSMNQWNQRSIELKKKVTNSYAAIK